MTFAGIFGPARHVAVLLITVNRIFRVCFTDCSESFTAYSECLLFAVNLLLITVNIRWSISRVSRSVSRMLSSDGG